MKNYLIYQSLRQTSYDCKIGNSPKNSFVGVVFNDTLLHLGLNPFDFTLGQLFTAFDLYKNGVYSNNYEDLKVFSVANILYPHINYNDQYFSEQMNTARNFVNDADVFYNFQLDSPTGIIYDQTKGPQSQYRFGLTTVSSMGCEGGWRYELKLVGILTLSDDGARLKIQENFVGSMFDESVTEIVFSNIPE